MSHKDVGAGGKQQLKYIQPLAAPATLVTFLLPPIARMLHVREVDVEEVRNVPSVKAVASFSI